MPEGQGDGARVDPARQMLARAEATVRDAHAAATAPERAALLRDAARAFYAGGDVARGHRADRAAYDACPEDDAAFLEALRDAAADIDRLESVLAARARAVPVEAGPCARARADALLAFGRTHDAVDAYRACLADAPGEPALLAGLAEAHAELGEAEESLRVARRLVEVSEGLDARRAALDTAAKLASRFGDRGPDAADLLESAAGIHLRTEGPANTTHVLVERAVQALVRAGENARAGSLMALAARVAEGPVRAQWLARFAETAIARGDVGAARAARAEALRADPTNAELRQIHLSEIEASGDHAALVSALEDALDAREAEVAPLLLRLGRARTDAGDATGAAHAFACLCEVGPGHAGWDAAARALTTELAASGHRQIVAQLELARRGPANEPASVAASLLAACSLFENAGDAVSARRVAERAREVDPRSAEAWSAIARLDLAAGDRAAAARALLEASSRSSGATGAAAALEAARLFDAAGLDNHSVAALRAAIEAGPGSPVARRILAERAREAGDLAGAVRHLASVDTAALSPEDRAAHDRALARALSEACDPAAFAAWRVLFERDEADGEAFDRLAETLRARGDLQGWLDLATRHDEALATGEHQLRRADLRCERAAILSDLGEIEAAEIAWRSALQLSPRSRRARRGMRALLEQRGDHAGAAAEVAAEAAVVDDPEEAAELFIDEARIRLEILHDRDGAAHAVAAATDRLMYVPPRRARRLLALAGRMGIPADLLALGGTSAMALNDGSAHDGAASETDDGGVAEDERLRKLAASVSGSERAACLHRLSVRLERRGDAPAAFDVAVAALEADPTSAERFDRAVQLARGDSRRLVAAHRIRVRGARTPTARAKALVDLGTLLGASPDTLLESVQVLERAAGLDPASGAAAAALARALLAVGEPERAITELSRFEGGATDLSPAAAVQLLVEAARAAGDPARAVEMASRAAERNPRDPAVLAALSQALTAVGRERDAIAVEERAIALQAPGAERLDRRAALAARAEAAGDHARALWLYQGVRTARPDDVAVLAGLARIYAASNDAFQLASVARDLQRLGATSAVGGLAVTAARALLRSGDAAAALAFLRDAHRLVPDDLSVLRDLAMAAERAGSWSEALSAGAAVADAETERHPSAATARLQHLAEIAAVALGDPQLAAHLRQRAAALSPFEAPPADGVVPVTAPEPPREREEGAIPRSVEQALARVREAPFDPVAAGQLAGLARLLGTGAEGPHAVRLSVIARSAGAIAAFATGTTPRNVASPRPIPVPLEQQLSNALPPARSSTARLFALLCPWLEPLFPADLNRRGVTATDQLGPERFPELLLLFDSVRLALGVRPCLPYLRPGQGLGVDVENTAPPSLVLAGGFANSASAAERRFLLGRALALVEAGWALAGKSAPRDLRMMCELACRLGGFTPSVAALPESRARSFLQALSNVPERVRRDAAQLAASAVRELPGLNPPELVDALRQSAARTALLHGGDPHAALTATLNSDPRLVVLPRTEALGHADLRDLAVFAVSEEYLRTRAEAEAAA